MSTKIYYRLKIRLRDRKYLAQENRNQLRRFSSNLKANQMKILRLALKEGIKLSMIGGQKKKVANSI
jgi:hypothetical protein